MSTTSTSTQQHREMATEERDLLLSLLSLLAIHVRPKPIKTLYFYANNSLQKAIAWLLIKSSKMNPIRWLPY